MTWNLLREDQAVPSTETTTPATPGRVPASARIAARPQIVLRMDSPEVARAFAGAFGPRDDNGVAAGADVAVDRAASSSGAPLPDGVRTQFESSLGADLSSVRVHTGADSAAAASAVGAKAYTVGQDIHFAEGHYAPSDPFGMHLLAHEVAHTVQQEGGTPHRQNKLEVSTPGDAAELEADRAADAMVTGHEVSVTPMSGIARMIHRDPDKSGDKDKDKDKAWATDIRTKVEAVQEAAQHASETLNADADVALKSLQAAQGSYYSFESAYNQAVGRFTTGVKKAMEAAEELRANVKAVAAVALAQFGGEVGELLLKAGEAAEKVASAAEFVDKLSAGKGGPAGAPKEGGEKPDTKPGPTSQTDWKQLFQTAIDSYDKYIKGNKSISAITRSCLDNVKFLNTVIGGKPADNVRSSPDGQRAEHFGAGAAAAIGQLTSIAPGSVSAGAAEFAKNVSNALDHQSAQKIEQDIAIKWISGLTKEQLGAIGDAGSYLKKLGVIDSKGNRLGVDTGNWTTEWDEMIIRVRAQVEQRAKEMVGSTRRWGGGKLSGGSVRGQVAGDEQSSNWWSAVGPANTKEAAGGEVRVLSFSIEAIDKEVSSNWEHCNESELGSRMISKVTLTIEPFGESKNAEAGASKE